MTIELVHIDFTRQLSDDLDVIRSTPWAQDPDHLQIQFKSEFPDFDGRLEVAEVVIPPVGDEYVIKATIQVLDAGDMPLSMVLENLADELQKVYSTECAGGRFEITSVRVDGFDLPVDDIFASSGLSR